MASRKVIRPDIQGCLLPRVRAGIQARAVSILSEVHVKTLRGLVWTGVLVSMTPMWAQSPTDVGLMESPVYQKHCAKCHGKNAEGRHFGGPSLRSDKVNSASNEDLRNIIGNGKGHMPKYADKLSAEEIDALVKQIKALSKNP